MPIEPLHPRAGLLEGGGEDTSQGQTLPGAPHPTHFLQKRLVITMQPEPERARPGPPWQD